MLALKRLIASLVIFVPFGFYVFAIQAVYEHTNTTNAPLYKATLFLIALLAGSVTYDATKHSLFMKEKYFNQFFSKLMETWVVMVILVLLLIASAVLLHYNNIFPLWLGASVYGMALICTVWAVMAGTAAIGIATKK